MPLLRLLALLTALLASCFAAAQVPGLINYQGRISVGGVNFDGTGLFKFALVSADGSETYWTNDGTQSGAPIGAVSVPVSRGLYSIQLGSSPMPEIPVSTFSGRTDVRLRIWFNDGVNGFELLAPDQRFTSVAYAMVAGSVAPEALGTGTITGTLGCQVSATEGPGSSLNTSLVSIPGSNFLAVPTDPSGQTSSYTLFHVPEGTHQVRVQSRNGVVATQQVIVTAGATSTLDFDLSLAACTDADGDGHGNPSLPQAICLPFTSGVSVLCDDANDANRFIFPGAIEYCDGVDNNGEGTIDEACVAPICSNGILEPGEQCDDGNTDFGDTCSPSCTILCTSNADCPASLNPCKANVCDEATNVCVEVNASGSCNDGNACTLNDFCSGGVCQPGVAKSCNDSNICTTDVCDPATGECSAVFNTASCNDGNACTLNDRCFMGTCSGGTAKNCSDGNPCTNDLCNPANGVCSWVATTASCSDGNGCTVGDVCSGGVCTPGTSSNCFPGVTCTNLGGSSFLCGPCPAGYSGNGINCVDTDACSPNPCFPGVACNDIPAPGVGFTCGPCPAGYTGDGIVCTPL